MSRENSLDWQSNNLKHLRDLCTDLNTESGSEGETAQEISTVIRVLNEHLESLSYSPNSIVANGTYDTYGMPKDPIKKENDEISKIKFEIRSVKGVLLSAKNFPGGRRAAFPQTTAAG